MKSALESADSRIRRRENSSRRMRRGRRAGNVPTKFMAWLGWAMESGRSRIVARGQAPEQPHSAPHPHATSKRYRQNRRGTFCKRQKSYLQTVIRLPLPSLSGCPWLRELTDRRAFLRPRVTPLDAGAFLFFFGAGSLLTAPAPCTLFAKRNVPCRWPAPIRGRSHPIRLANGSWLAAHGASSLHAVRKTECPVSLAGADSRAHAPHSPRERELARCSRRPLPARWSQHGMSRVAGRRRFAGARTPFASRTGAGSLLTALATARWRPPPRRARIAGSPRTTERRSEPSRFRSHRSARGARSPAR